jgi:trans-aconitate 2-methyltransferase
MTSASNTPCASDFWSPADYNRFQKNRSRPFHDLMAHVSLDSPRHIVDLGCGPGNLTAAIADRWPEADVVGIDQSPAMIAAAHTESPSARLRYEVGDLQDWAPDDSVDLLLCSVALQWVPEHIRLFPRFVESLSNDGCFAFQVPGQSHLTASCYEILYELAAHPEWAHLLSDPLRDRPRVQPSHEYIELLAGLGCTVDAWETEYFFILDGADAVLSWMLGTAARPIIMAINDGHQRERFLRAYRERLGRAYPQRPFGTIFPQHRLSVVAWRGTCRQESPA